MRKVLFSGREFADRLDLIVNAVICQESNVANIFCFAWWCV